MVTRVTLNTDPSARDLTLALELEGHSYGKAQWRLVRSPSGWRDGNLG
jgi:hypothetical protein